MQNILLYAATVMIWGTTFFAIKFQLGVVDPFVSVSYRYAIAGVLLLAYCAASGRLRQRLTVKQHSYMALFGLLLFCLSYCMTYTGTQYLASGLVSVCFSTITVMNIINQRIIFKIPINKQVVIGTALGLIGITLIFAPEVQAISLHDATMLGIAICIFAAYLASLGNMASMKNKALDIPVTVSTGYGMLYGALFAGILALIMGKDFGFSYEAPYIISLLYLAIFGSIVAFLCFLTLINNIGADKAAYATILFPAIALALSTIYEGYEWSALSILGFALIIGGNIIAMRKTKAQKGLTKIRG